MNVEDIRTLFAYNHWANRRILATAGLLSADDFAGDPGTSHGSVRTTLAHILGGEWVWLHLWRGEVESSKPIVARRDELWKPERFPDAAALEAGYHGLAQDQDLFIQQLTDERVRVRISFENSLGLRCDFSLGHMMQHVVNHSSYHRGQAMTLLRQLGQEPPDTDLVIYLLEQGI